jgi:hypothetical protein
MCEAVWAVSSPLVRQESTIKYTKGQRYSCIIVCGIFRRITLTFTQLHQTSHGKSLDCQKLDHLFPGCATPTMILPRNLWLLFLFSVPWIEPAASQFAKRDPPPPTSRSQKNRTPREDASTLRMPSSSNLRSFDGDSATATQPTRNVTMAIEAEALASSGQFLRRNVDISPRIYGGEDAKSDRFPYYVALVDNNMNLICGGSLIASDIVLTAAHCK